MTERRICIVPEYPLSLMTGGVQVQALATFKALKEQGLNVELFSWCAEIPPADLYHFVGFPSYLSSLAALLHRKGIPYVCTILCGGHRSRTTLWAARLRHNLNAVLPCRPEYHESVMGADTIVVITHADAAVVRYVFGVPSSRVVVVENGVDERYRLSSPSLWRQRYGDRPFVLCVGHIQSRKNQLFLLKVANQSGVPVVLIGAVMSGQEEYARHVESEIRANAVFGGMWLRDLSADDPLLVSAYAACQAYILLSHQETQPLSVLEAMAAGKPVLLGDASYTRECPFEGLATTSRTQVSVASRDIETLWKHGAASSLPAAFSWGQVAGKLNSVYERALGRVADFGKGML